MKWELQIANQVVLNSIGLCPQCLGMVYDDV